MRTSVVFVVIAWSAIGGATDKPQAGRYMPSGNWKGICADGNDEWGDPMPIEIAFRPSGGLTAAATLEFDSGDGTQRKATATLRGKRVSEKSPLFVLRGKMIETSDATEWDIELQVSFDGTRLSGKFIELAEPHALMCTFNWTHGSKNELDRDRKRDPKKPEKK